MGNLTQYQTYASEGLLSRRPLSRVTLYNYSRIIKQYLKQYNTVTAPNVHQFLIEIPKDRAYSRQHAVKSLTSYTKYLVMIGEAEQSLVDSLKSLRFHSKKIPNRPVLTEEEFWEVFNALPKKNYVDYLTRGLFGLMYYTGMRRAECCSLTIDSVDWEDKVIHVNGKGDKYRRLGINDKLLQILSEYYIERLDIGNAFFVTTSGSPLTTRCVNHYFEVVSKVAGKRITPHTLRRTFITVNAKKGVPIALLQAAAGHSNLSTLQSYLQVSPDDVSNAMKGW
jgi:site-specific recombinase XerD